MKHVASFFFAFLLIAFAGFWAFVAYRSGSHSALDTGVIFGSLIGAIALAIPARADIALKTIAPYFPPKRRDDADR